MKKVLAVVLAAAMLLTMGITAFAASADYVDTAAFAQGVNEDGVLVLDSGTDKIAPDNSIYFPLPSYTITLNGVPVGRWNASDYTDKDLFKIKFDKGDYNAKMIKSITLSEKLIAGSRGPWMKVELNDNYTDDEFKLAPSATITSKKNFNTAGVVVTTGGVPSGYKIEYKVGKFYTGNSTDDADQDYAAGTGGVMLKPTKNDDNEITWEDENNTIARLTFFSDDDAAKFFPKLRTYWDNQDYAEYFADQDAFIFDFVSNPKIASTSRATLELYNPYYDTDEDELRVDPEDVVIYQVDVDGALVDVTASFKATENEDGDSVFTTKTRQLGTYIIAEKVAGSYTDDVTDTPDTGKDIPNTGR